MLSHISPQRENQVMPQENLWKKSKTNNCDSANCLRYCVAFKFGFRKCSDKSGLWSIPIEILNPGSRIPKLSCELLCKAQYRISLRNYVTNMYGLLFLHLYTSLRCFVYEYFSWTTDIDFLELRISQSTITDPQDVSASGSSFRIFDWISYQDTHLDQIWFLSYDILLGSSRSSAKWRPFCPGADELTEYPCPPFPLTFLDTGELVA